MTSRSRSSLPVKAATISAAALMTPQIAFADPSDGQFYGHYGMMNWGGWVFGPIMMVIFFALLVGAVVLIARLLGAGQFHVTGAHHPGGDRSLAILRERFAKGEMTAEEFAAARKTLED
ncbi:SHOCT domain-containing protein [Albidovulum sediminicola]|uniref:SHOCT domain-containing protein n=1 Tax=Albidovulum sediminicola TaxID=2984331 RepID=A0ABT2Z6D2_9RHOB|nr:SHOCT domain-containing protein [Defluviimonas sp. WL0075]MCV2866557.1 SHOCT domain-containing protein [Defluviimonas sp. WL0075]